MTTGLQERIESSRAGQIVLSLFIVVTLVAIGITDMPESLLRREASKVTDSYLKATGLEQRWRIFAPTQRPFSLRLEAQVRYDDGSIAIWRPPAGGDLIGAFWDYRWRKWFEHVANEDKRKALWRPAAEFAARQLRRPGRTPRSVTLVLFRQELRPPGAPGADRGPWRSEAIYTLALS